MSSVSDISVEFAHLYLANVDTEQAALAAQLASRWLKPVIGSYEHAGLTVSTVVMVDDYFAPEGTEVEEKVAILEDACVKADMRIDHFVYESACAESIDRMNVHLHQEPRLGDGSSSPAPGNVGSAWLSNSDPPRSQARDSAAVGRLARPVPSAAQAARAATRSPARGHHSIHLDVQLFTASNGHGDRLWACPALSAWWQLIRLGMLRDDPQGRPQAPPRTRSKDGAPPLAARRTLTLLDPRFLEIEHAVRAILERLSLPEAWRRYLREGPRPPDVHEHLNRIAYMFVPGGFRQTHRGS